MSYENDKKRLIDEFESEVAAIRQHYNVKHGSEKRADQLTKSDGKRVAQTTPEPAKNSAGS